MKFKAVLRYPHLKFKCWRAGRIYKKSLKIEDRYDAQWKFDYVLKITKRYFKAFKINLNIEGYENLPKKSFILAPNHQSSIDIPALVLAMKKQTHDRDISNRRLIFVAKKSILKNKWISNFAKLIECKFLDRSNPREALKVMNELSSYLKENKVGVVIFPEGTRTKDGTIGEFKGGSFRLVKKNFIPIVPVTINNSKAAFNFKRKKITIDIIFHKPLKPLKLISMSNQDIANKVRKIVKSRYIPTTFKSKKEESKF